MRALSRRPPMSFRYQTPFRVRAHLCILRYGSLNLIHSFPCVSPSQLMVAMITYSFSLLGPLVSSSVIIIMRLSRCLLQFLLLLVSHVHMTLPFLTSTRLSASHHRKRHRSLYYLATLTSTTTTRTSSSAQTKTGRRLMSTFDIYPFDAFFDCTKGDKNVNNNANDKRRHTKVVHFVRHAEGFHNVNQNYRSKENLDARLTPLGIQQCQALARRIQNANDKNDSSEAHLYHLRQSTELIVTSPLSRCIQTALLSFEPLLLPPSSLSSSPLPLPLQEAREGSIRIVAHEAIRETVNYNCDRRRLLTDIASEHGHLDYSHVPTNHDAIWKSYQERFGCDETYPHHRESGDIHVVAERGREFFQWLEQRPERHVVVCTHSAFMRCLWNYGHPGGVPRLPPQHDGTDCSCTQDALPVVRYNCRKDVDTFAKSMREDYENCELRSVVVAFG